MPNITGYFENRVPASNSYSAPAQNGGSGGAFYAGTATTTTIGFNFTNTASKDINNIFALDASRSSSVYGNSTTVQPPALTMKPFIYTGKTALYKWLRTA